MLVLCSQLNEQYSPSSYLKKKPDGAGVDTADATSSHQQVPNFAAELQSREQMPSRPLEGLRIGIVQQMMGAGISEGVTSAVQQAYKHLESLGAILQEVRWRRFTNACTHSSSRPEQAGVVQ